MFRGINKLSAVACASIGLAALFAPSAALAQEEAPTRTDTVTVGARQEVDIEPDLGTVSFGVRVQSLSAERATDKLGSRTGRVISAIRNMGFTNDEIETYGVQLQRVCVESCRDPNPRDNKVVRPVFGYRGTSGVRVETDQLGRIGELIDAGIRAGANSIRGISFGVSDKTAAVNEALRQAMEVATDKARTLAEAGNRNLGRALVIEEGNTRAPDTYSVPEAAAYGRIVDKSGSAGGGASANPFPIEPPTLSASARVTVTFELD